MNKERPPENSTISKKSPKKIPLKAKLGYGAAELSASMTWTMVAVCFFFFLTEVVGLNPIFAGFVMMVGKLWDAVTDPMIGIFSDRIKTRWGRRRPFIFTIAVPYGFIIWLLFSDFGLSEPITKIYFIIAILMYNTAQTILEVPYTSLAAEMTQDYDERTRLFSFRAVYSQIGSIAAAALPWTLAPLLSEMYGGGSDKVGWSLMTAIFGFFAVFPILVTWRATRGYELYPEHTAIKLKDIFSGPFKNRTFLYTMGIYAISNTVIGAVGTLMEYYMKYYMNFSELEQTLAFVFLFACTIFWIPLIGAMSSKYGKRESYIVFILMWVVIQVVGIPFLQPSMKIPFYIIMILASGGVITVTMIGWSMIPDAVEVDEFKSGQRREGLYVGIIMFLRKLVLALALLILGFLLDRIGYDGKAEMQMEGTVQGIKALFIIFPSILLTISLILAYFLPMTRKRHKALKEAIRLKNEGKEWDVDSVKDVL